jgi:polysaccharide export outer membrane protein
MKFKFFTIIIGLFILLSSCVPQKNLVYLQGKEKLNQSTTNEVSKKPYRIQINDILIIKIKTLDETLSEMFSISQNTGNNRMMVNEQAVYFDGYPVDYHGNIRIPLLGEINVFGQTLDEIREKIEKKLLADHLTENADLFVSVRLAGVRYTINGEVSAPGTKVLYQDRVNILEAIANAGDISIIGDRKNVVLVRLTPQGTEMHSLDLTDAAIINSPYFYIQPNDYILVNPLKQKSWGTGTTGLQSLTTVITLLSLITSVIILTNR